MAQIFCSLLLVATFFATVESHSWASCVKWNTGTSSCEGYIRNWFKQPSQPFSQDLGWDRRPGRSVAAGGLFCDDSKQQAHANPSDGYSAQFPMAVYKPGSTVTIQWPAKNHASVGTPRGTQLFFGKAPGAGDDYSHISSKEEWIGKYPKLEADYSTGCQPNTPGIDGAPCFGDYEIPADLSNGIYSVIWWWEFNQGEFYSSCYDVLIDGSADGGGGDGGGEDSVPGTGDDTDECNGANLPSCQATSLASVGKDGLGLEDPPSGIPGALGSTFSLTIAYDATEAQRIVVDVLGAAGGNDETGAAFYGGGLGSAVLVQAGSGKLEYTVVINDTPITSGSSGIYVKVWNVRESQWSDDVDDAPWKNEITRVDLPVAVGDAVVKCADIPAACLRAAGISDTDSGSDTGALAGTIVVLVVVMGLAAGVSFFAPATAALSVLKAGDIGRAVVRFAQSLLALVAFTAWVAGGDIDACNCAATSNFFIAAGVLIWIYTMVLFLMLVGRITGIGVQEGDTISLFVLWPAQFVDVPFCLFGICAVVAAAYHHPKTTHAGGAIAALFFCTSFLLFSLAIQLGNALQGRQQQGKSVDQKDFKHERLIDPADEAA